MAIEKLNIGEKADNQNKKALLTRLGIPKDESLSAQETNLLVGKTNELVDKTNELNNKIETYKPIDAFNFKGNVTTYANLPTTGLTKDDAYGVIADGLVYIYNGTTFPTSGNGLNLGLKPTGTVGEGVQEAVSGGVTYNYIDEQLSEELTSDLVIGGINTADGTNATSTTRARSNNYMSGNKAVVTSPNLFLFRVYYYASDNTFINSVATGYVTEYNITYPSGATKYRMALSKNPNTDDIIQSDVDNSILTYGKKRYEFDYIEKSKVLVSDYDLSKININKNLNELGGIATSNGINADNNIRIRTKGFINLDQNIIYKIENIPNGFVLNSLYKYKNNLFVSRVADPPLTITTDNTFDQIRLVFSKTNNTESISNRELIDFNYIITTNRKNKIQELSVKTNELSDKVSNLQLYQGGQWIGKKIVGLGDSNTYGFIPRNATGYPGQLTPFGKIVANKLGMDFFNFGISGSTLGQVSASDSTTRSPMVNRVAELPNDADLVFFMGGTNDLRNISVLGVMTDRVKHTFYGALHVLFQELQNKYVYNQLDNPKKVIALTPPKLYPNDTYNGFDIEDYRNAVLEVANYYSIPCYDMWGLNGINPSEFRTLQGTEVGYTDVYNPLAPDGVHFTQKGHEIIAESLLGFINSL